MSKYIFFIKKKVLDAVIIDEFFENFIKVETTDLDK